MRFSSCGQLLFAPSGSRLPEGRRITSTTRMPVPSASSWGWTSNFNAWGGKPSASPMSATMASNSTWDKAASRWTGGAGVAAAGTSVVLGAVASATACARCAARSRSISHSWPVMMMTIVSSSSRMGGTRRRDLEMLREAVLGRSPVMVIRMD